MNNEENNFEEFLRSKLENHTVEVSDSVWANIEKKQKKRNKFIWFKHYLNLFVAMDILLFAAFAGFTFINNNEVKSENKMLSQNLPMYQKTSQEKQAQQSVINKAVISKNVEESVLRNTDENANENIYHTVNGISKINQSKTSSIANKSKQSNIIQNTSNNINSNKYSKQLNEVATEDKISQSAVHSVLTQNMEANKIYDIAYLPTISLQNIAITKAGFSEINSSPMDLGFLPPSIVLSKSKKLLKQEQKAKEKMELEKMGTAQNSTVKQPTSETVKPTQNNISNAAVEATLLKNESEEAMINLDTVYGHKKFKGYFAIDALFAPEITGRTLRGENQEVSNYISRRDSAEKLSIGYSAIMRINLFLNRNIFIGTGINFSQRKEKFSIIHKWKTHEPYIDSSEFVTYVDPFEGNIIYKTYDTLDYVRTHKDTLKHNLVMSFIDIPAMIGYKWLGKRSGIALQGGVMFNLLFKQKGSNANFNYTANDVKNNNDNPFNTNAGISLCGAISTNFKLRDNLDLLIEPQTRYILKPIHNNAYPLQQKLFSYGLNVGLRLKL